MAKYATLKAERDDAIARAVEAERLSNKAELDKLVAERDGLVLLLSQALNDLEGLRSDVAKLHERLGRIKDLASPGAAGWVASTRDGY